MNICFFSDDYSNNFKPLTLTRPVDDLRIGIYTIREKWNKVLKPNNWIRQVEDHISSLFPIGDFALHEEYIWINSRFLPSNHLIKSIHGLKSNQSLTWNDVTVASRISFEDTESHIKATTLPSTRIAKELEFEPIELKYFWDLLSNNSEQIKFDIKLLPASFDRASGFDSSVVIKNLDQVYIHSTATIEPGCIIIADEGSLPDSLSKEVLLVGYGKFGAEGTMDAIQKEKGSLAGKKITLAGTLIYGDGKTLMELTKENESLINVVGPDNSPVAVSPPQSPISVKGEILDPKCYFGVMKPGEGKIHKSCAIRCISGGIPPVFRHQMDDHYQYFLMVDENGNRINEEVLPFVAEQISIDGKTKKSHGWDVLYLNVADIKMEN